jgi:uncharacterized coiled-coil protein SlyX
MAEVISRRFNAPESLNDYSQVEFRAYPGGKFRFFGVGEESKLKPVGDTPDLEASLFDEVGFNYSEWKNSKKATWTTTEEGEPVTREVTVIGMAGIDKPDTNNRKKDIWLYKVENHELAIPANELEFVKDEHEENSEEGLKAEMASLRAQVFELKTAVAGLTRVLEEAGIRPANVENRNANANANANESLAVGDAVEIKDNNGRWIGGFELAEPLIPGQTTQVKNLRNRGKFRMVNSEDVRRPGTTETPGQQTTEFRRDTNVFIDENGDGSWESARAEGKLGDDKVVVRKENGELVSLDAARVRLVDEDMQPQPTPSTRRPPRRGLLGRMRDLRYGPPALDANRRVGRRPGDTVVADRTTVVEDRPAGPAVAETEVIEDDRRNRLGLFAGGVAVGAVATGIAWWAVDTYLKRHGGCGIDEHTRDLITQNNHRIDTLQTTVNGQKGTINHMAGQLNHDTTAIDRMGRKIHKLIGIVGDLKKDEAREAAAAKLSNFSSNSFFGRTPHEAISNAFGVIRDNDIRVRGLTSHKINLIAQYMEQHHWHIASGVDASGNQHIVDTANWASGHTDNWTASGQQGAELVNGSTANWWHRFMHVASHYGVTFKAKA